MRSRPLLAVPFILSSLTGCFSFGDCDEEEVLSCLEEACASGQLLGVTCACVAKGKTFDGAGDRCH